MASTGYLCIFYFRENIYNQLIKLIFQFLGDVEPSDAPQFWKTPRDQGITVNPYTPIP